MINFLINGLYASPSVSYLVASACNFSIAGADPDHTVPVSDKFQHMYQTALVYEYCSIKILNRTNYILFIEMLIAQDSREP